VSELKFNTTINYDDYNAFQKAAVQDVEPFWPKAFDKYKQSPNKLGRKLSRVALYVVSVVIMYFLFSLDIKGIVYIFPTVIITALVFLFLQKDMLKKLKPLPNGSIIGVHEYTLTDEKIIVQKGDHRESSTYNSILNIVESENNLFLFIDSFNAYIINKKNISSELPLDEITLYLREKCNIKVKERINLKTKNDDSVKADIKVEVVNTNTGKAVKVAEALLSFTKTTLFYVVVIILGWCIIEFITALKDVHTSSVSAMSP
jgi:hypothetical protein